MNDLTISDKDFDSTLKVSDETPVTLEQAPSLVPDSTPAGDLSANDGVLLGDEHTLGYVQIEDADEEIVS